MRWAWGALFFAVACGGRTGPLLAPKDAGGCGDVPTSPQLVTTIGAAGELWSAWTLTALGADVYYLPYSSMNYPRGLYRVPSSSGTPERVVEGEEPDGCGRSWPIGFGPLVDDGQRIFMNDEVVDDTCSGYSRHVTAYDASDGDTSTLPNPSYDPQRRLSRVRTGSDGVYALFAAPDYHHTDLVRWDDGLPTVLASIDGYGVDFVLAGGRAFVQTVTNELLEVPLGGGAITTLMMLEPEFRFWGATSDAIFYALRANVIERRDVSSGARSTITSDPTLGFVTNEYTPYVDEDFVYLPKQLDLYHQSLVRIPNRGGAPEELTPVMPRNIFAVTSDACRVYWIAGSEFESEHPLPASIFARRR